jgi:hypothetical protein
MGQRRKLHNEELHDLYTSPSTIRIIKSRRTMLGGSTCHHSMTRPRVTDGRDGLQLSRLAVNILNKQPLTNNKGCFSSLGVGRGANNPSS